MAGAEGFEPPLAVLETAGLPLNLRPSGIGQKPRGFGQSNLSVTLVQVKHGRWKHASFSRRFSLGLETRVPASIRCVLSAPVRP